MNLLSAILEGSIVQSEGKPLNCIYICLNVSIRGRAVVTAVAKSGL